MISEFISYFKDIDFVYTCILMILSIGLIISSLEDIVNRSIYTKAGLLSWNISKHRSSFFANSCVSEILDFILDDRSFVALLYLKFILSTALFLSAMLGVISPILIFSVFVFMLLVSTRSQYGLDGAYQMNLVVLFGLTIATFSGLHSKISSICLWFICGELVLSYFISGIAKAISPIWRKTYALNAVFSTKTYGHEGMFNIVTKYKHLAFILCWPMFLFELFFPSAFFSEYLCVIFCLIGISFHLFNAVFMGLNTFFFAFLSTYPAFIYCVAKLN